MHVFCRFELTAAATLIGFWDTTTSEGVWIAVILVAITTINLCGARTFGEFEFWFASIKVRSSICHKFRLIITSCLNLVYLLSLSPFCHRFGQNSSLSR